MEHAKTQVTVEDLLRILNECADREKKARERLEDWEKLRRGAVAQGQKHVAIYDDSIAQAKSWLAKNSAECHEARVSHAQAVAERIEQAAGREKGDVPPHEPHRVRL